MSKPVIFVTRKLPRRVEARLGDSYEARLNAEDRLYGREEFLAAAAGADGLLATITDVLDAGLIAALPESVRIIATYSVGHEHIDVAAAGARGIVVTNTPGVLTEATADIALLLLLGAARRAAEGARMVLDGRWGPWAPTGMLGKDLGGHRLGILGMGRIGRAVARRARGFGMEIHYHNRHKLPPDLEHGATYHESAEALLAVAEFLSLNAASTPETRHFLNRERIALLPDGAVVVNTARGDLIEESSLIEALRSGKLAAAGLDVFQNEPDINPDFRTLDNAFLLPHLGSATVGAREAMGFAALDNLDAFFADAAPPNPVG